MENANIQKVLDKCKVRKQLLLGEQAAVKNVGRKVTMLQLELGKYKDPYIQSMYDYQRELEQEVRKSKDKSFYVWVTVNPPPTVDFDVFRKKVEKCVKKVWVKNHWYAFEQRGTEVGQYGGYHTHMLLERGNIRPSHCKRELISTFAGITKQVDIKFIPQVWGKDKLAYITGEKTGEGKAEKQIIDKAFRAAYKLEPLYQSIPFKG